MIGPFDHTHLTSIGNMELTALTEALSQHLPPVMRWAGAVARRMRQFNISLETKSSGSPNTDALTLADLTVQELLVSALRDGDPLFRRCKIQAEEWTGDLDRFAQEAEYAIVIDPIDGTKQYRDHTGDGYSVMLSLQTPETVEYSLVYVPEEGEHGTWVYAAGDEIRVGPDDPSQPAGEVFASLPRVDPAQRKTSRKIYLIGFQEHDCAKAQLVTGAGLEGVVNEDMGGCHYSLLARGDFTGSLIHTPNIYDFPVGLHISRILGGDALWVHNSQSVNLRETWNDERADMLRLPGIIACSPDRDVLKTLCDLARDWNPNRYAD